MRERRFDPTRGVGFAPARRARHGAGPMAHDSGGEADGPVVILIPLFNDWASFTELVDRLDVVLGEHGLRAEVLIVDDGSTIEPSADGVGAPAPWARCGGSTCSGCGGTWAISGRSPSAWPTSRAAWRATRWSSWTAMARMPPRMYRGSWPGSARRGAARSSSPNGRDGRSRGASTSSTRFTSCCTSC